MMKVDFSRLSLRDCILASAIAISLIGLVIVLYSAVVPAVWSHLSPTAVMVGQERVLRPEELAKTLDYAQNSAVLGLLMMIGGGLALQALRRRD